MYEYRLACTDCSFATVVSGDIDAVFDEIEAHRAEYERAPEDHFVNFEVISSS